MITIVRLNLTGVSPGTSQCNRALAWIRQRELSIHAHRPGHLIRFTGVDRERGVPDSDRRRFAAGTTEDPIKDQREVIL